MKNALYYVFAMNEMTICPAALSKRAYQLTRRACSVARRAKSLIIIDAQRFLPSGAGQLSRKAGSE